MQDRTRRLLCRVTFFSLCVAPTLGVCLWRNALAGAEHREACAAELSQALGLKVSAASVTHPQPGATLYSGVELSDAETGSPLARMRFLELGGGAGVVGVSVSQAEVDGAELRRLWEIVQLRLARSTGADSTVRLVSSDVTLHLPSGGLTLTEVLGQIDARGAGGQRAATLSFRVAGADASEPVRLRCARKASDGRVTTSLEINTGGAAIPCGVLLGPLGIPNHLGDRARFRGSIWANESADGWEGELSGQLAGVDLDSVVTDQFPHRLSGVADVTIQKAKFHRGRLEEVEGAIAAGPGVIGASLLASLAEHLRLSATGIDSSTSKTAENAALEFDEVSAHVVLDSTGITVRGQCRDVPGAIARQGATILLADGSSSPSSAVALLRALVPQSEVQAPATRQTGWLMQLLPAPPIMPPPGTLPHGKVRLGGPDKAARKKAGD